MAVQLTPEMIQGAKESEIKYGIPSSITLGQIMLESGGRYEGGLSQLGANYNNLFGMKGSGIAGTVSLPTEEQTASGKTYTTMSNFRVYNSKTESIQDHAKLLSTDRYTKHTSQATTIEEWAKAIQKGGYATDISYSEKLIRTIKNNNLTQYDSGNYSQGVLIGATQENNFSNLEVVGTNGEYTPEFTITGQIIRFIVFFGLCVLAVVFLMSAVGGTMPNPMNMITKGSEKKK